MKDIIKMDMDKTGLYIFFKDYEVSALNYLMDNPSGSSLEVYQHIVLNDEIMISRASVINFLNKMVEWGLLYFDKESGKGGYHRIYYLPKTLKSRLGIISWFNAEIVKKLRNEGVGF